MMATGRTKLLIEMDGKHRWRVVERACTRTGFSSTLFYTVADNLGWEAAAEIFGGLRNGSKPIQRSGNISPYGVGRSAELRP